MIENELRMKAVQEQKLQRKQTVVEAHRLRLEEAERQKLEAEAKAVLEEHQKQAEAEK